MHTNNDIKKEINFSPEERALIEALDQDDPYFRRGLEIVKKGLEDA